MKNKFFILIVVILIAMMVTPTPAYAFTGINGTIINGKDATGWAWDGSIDIYATVGATPGVLCGTATLTSPYTITYTCIPDPFSTVYVLYTFGPAPLGTPSSQIESFVELPFAGPNTINIVTDTGPTAIELVDFSVTPQSSGNTWLPFVLLIGSVALVSGAVVVIRKRKA